MRQKDSIAFIVDTLLPYCFGGLLVAASLIALYGLIDQNIARIFQETRLERRIDYGQPFRIEPEDRVAALVVNKTPACDATAGAVHSVWGKAVIRGNFGDTTHKVAVIDQGGGCQETVVLDNPTVSALIPNLMDSKFREESVEQRLTPATMQMAIQQTNKE